VTDIVKRLRSFDVFNAPMDIEGVMVSPVALMAADEIVRLRAERDTAEARATAAEAARDALLSNATNAALPALARADRAEEERDRLRDALLQIASSGVDGESLNLSRVGHAGCINVAKDALKEGKHD